MAARVLIIGGLANLVYGFVLGIFLSGSREKAPQAPRYLVLAHTGPLMQGPMLLSLVFAISLSDLNDTLETVAAALLVAGSAGIALKDTLNWVRGTADDFVTKWPSFYIAGVASVAAMAGLLILFVGAVAGL